MGRKPREFLSEGLYHIIQRGNNRNYIYEDIQDKKRFFQLLLDAREKCGFQILYFVLMDNHYHLLLESGEVPISKGIQRLNTAYSKYYNKKYNRTGGICGGRCTQSLVTDTRYFYQLLKYIARNPMKAGLVKRPEEYRWSAHPDVKAGKRHMVNIDRLLSYFPSHGSKALTEYINLIENEAEITTDYGLLPVKEEKKLADALNYIMKTIGLNESQIQRIRKGDKNRQLQPDRNRFIQEAYAAGFQTKEIANHISYTYEAVRKILQGYESRGY